ncbi:hypothetical protein IQ230_23465 [Gloeocapsopsis crepidinum LEGE 06123]|uniref:Uncharacterized protein n=1 Tax=Gloeocapsopsis crepidinum LEGE 06123 TaxID=588587 RepID=A0ABR9UY47_9CHRO|nr:hypothetical protein [Gloeocapsopsis crepidinum]MBE9193249.1 hypothetical protein [Gloeocapsopsis crepidinum LEGE 06123]
MVVKTLVKKILSPSIGFLKFPSLNEDIPSDLVPIGDTGLYTDIGQPVDPLDCRRYPGSIFCGNPLSPNALSLSIQIVRNPCNLGIKLTGSLAFIKMPPKYLVYRDPECRFDDESDKISPDDLPLEFSSDCAHYLVQTFLADGFASAGYVSPFFFDPSANSATAYGVNLIDEESFVTFLTDFGSFNTGSFSARLRFATFFQGPEAEHDYFVASLFIYEFVPPRLTDSNEYISWRQSLGDFIASNGPLKYYRFCNGVYRPTNQQKKPPPPPLDQKEQEDDMGCCPQTNALLYDLLDKVDKLSEIVGVDEFPASLPQSLISKDEGFIGNLIPNPNKEIANLTQFLAWYVERFDEIMGQWEIPIEIKDSDPSTPGDQPKGVKLPNMAEAIAEMFVLSFQSYANSETLLNLVTRNLVETGTDKQQNFITYKLLQSLTDWVGFKQKDIKLEMPLTFSPNKTRFDELIQESIVQVPCVEFDDKFGLEADLMRFREAAGILQAVYKRKLDPKGNIKDQIFDYLLKTYAAMNKINDDGENFQEFINRVENGFTDIPTVGDATQPYGRPYTQRPKVRDLSDIDEQT